MRRAFPLYKGATRVAVYWGVPLVPLVVLFGMVAFIAMFFGLWWWGLLVPGWILMAQITKTNDRAFRVLWLWLQTKVWNRWRLLLRVGDGGEFWGASSYALGETRVRGRDAEERPWGG